LIIIANIKPIIEPIRPAYETAFGVDINDMPIYILVTLAAVKYHFDVLFYLYSGVKCLSENFESVNAVHLSLGDYYLISSFSSLLFCILLIIYLNIIR
jgi:hypothetical protein